MTAQITLRLDPTTDTTGNAEQLARMIGELFMSMIIEDMGDKPQTIIIEGEGAQLGSEGLAEVQQNTSPMSPPVPQQGQSPMQGIETPRVEDNMPPVRQE